MEQYVFKRKNNEVNWFNVSKMWDKIVLAAGAIVAIKNPADVCIISAKQISRKVVRCPRAIDAC